MRRPTERAELMAVSVVTSFTVSLGRLFGFARIDLTELVASVLVGNAGSGDERFGVDDVVKVVAMLTGFSGRRAFGEGVRGLDEDRDSVGVVNGVAWSLAPGIVSGWTRVPT